MDFFCGRVVWGLDWQTLHHSPQYVEAAGVQESNTLGAWKTRQPNEGFFVTTDLREEELRDVFNSDKQDKWEQYLRHVRVIQFWVIQKLPGVHTRLKIWYKPCIIRQYIHSKTAENHVLFSKWYTLIVAWNAENTVHYLCGLKELWPGLQNIIRNLKPFGRNVGWHGKQKYVCKFFWRYNYKFSWWAI